MKLVGFFNLGKTCYFNSVLQCFINDQTFHDNIIYYNNPFVNEIKKIIKHVDLYTESYGYISISNEHLFNFFTFNAAETFDAYECFVIFLEMLIKNTHNAGNVKIKAHYNQHWKDFLTKNPSKFTKIYYGMLKTSIVCNYCDNSNESFEPFNSIMLPVKKKQCISGLLIDYLEPETITDYRCDKCKKINSAVKKISFVNVPAKITFVLKCYTQHTKLYNDIEIDSFKIKSKRYRPLCIINHLGNLKDGHYTSNILLEDQCFLINDEKVVVNKDAGDAYIIVYTTQRDY